MPRLVVQALLSTEDRRFYDHHGVDLRGMLRAAVHNATAGGAEGGSTLTMQLVKQERAYRARTPAEQQAAVSQDLNRKLKDAKCAVELEKRYPKAQILNEYLNVAFFGENSYGIETAARTYFDKPATKLTVPEGAHAGRPGAQPDRPTTRSCTRRPLATAATRCWPTWSSPMT